jgi:uncharacterized protein
MAHGYNCLKEFYLDKCAAAIAAAGHFVVAYDHRNFGESDGEPRQELDPWLQVRGYRNAITYAETLHGVDPDRVGIWGSSYAGGHVLVVAAIDRRVKCVVAVVEPSDRALASHASADAWRFFTGQLWPPEDEWRFAKWRNEITLRSLELYSEYEPGSSVERIAPPRY